MIKYKIQKSDIRPHTLNISLITQLDENEYVTVRLPTWRPGRYELANYAENLESISISENATIEKKTRHSWEINSLKKQKVVISYDYYAHKMDAGNSWVDENQIYINFINLLVGIKGKENLPCTVELNFPENYAIQCSLDSNGTDLLAPSYFELIDSPLFSSDTLCTYNYMIGGSNFELVIMGDYQPSPETLNDFEAFTKAQMNLFGGFPSKNFKFLIQALPYRHYHGVEHKNSTVITIGPDKHLSKRPLYKELLGVSSHELFHCWNVTRIKPKEFIPYDFSKECYYDTGFITEGLTTYYGDLMLMRANVFSSEEYFYELARSLQRHLENPGRFKQNLLESSMDLWIDGYKNQAPFRGVSIYTKGLIAALILDLMIIQKSNGSSSLDDVMKDLWNEFGDSRVGYDKHVYQNIISKYLGNSEAENYMTKYITGTELIEEAVQELLLEVGMEINTTPNRDLLQSMFGIKAVKSSNGLVIKKINEMSSAYKILSNEDLITHSVITGTRCKLEINSAGIKKTISLKSSSISFYPTYSLTEIKEPNQNQEKLKKYWLFRQ